MLPDTKEELFQEYYIAGDIKGLSVKYDLPVWFITFELAHYGIISIKPAMVVSKYAPKWTLDELRQGMRVHKNIRNLSKALGCDYSTVRLALRIYGVFPPAWKRSQPRQWRAEELQRDLDTCRTFSELTTKYKCNRITLVKILKKFDIDIPEEKIAHNPVRYVFDKEQLVKDYAELKTLTALKKKYGCSLYTIWKSFQEYDIPYDKRNCGVC